MGSVTLIDRQREKQGDPIHPEYRVNNALLDPWVWKAVALSWPQTCDLTIIKKKPHTVPPSNEGSYLKEAPVRHVNDSCFKFCFFAIEFD